MAEVFTISGPASEYVEMLGTPAVDAECARGVAVPTVAAVGFRLAAIPTTLFGGWRLYKGRKTSGFVALGAGIVTWFIAGRVLNAMGETFAACQKRGGYGS